VHLAAIPSDVDVVVFGPPGDVKTRLRYLQPMLLHDLDVLLGVEGLHAEILVPDEDVLVRRHDARVHEPLGIPPTRRRFGRHMHGISVSEMFLLDHGFYSSEPYHLACFLALMWMACFDHSNSSHSVVRPS
jgi:hypothetical protein